MILRLACMLLFLAGAAGAEGQSDPIQLATREALRGWEPVGEVGIQGTGYCSGVLIAPELVLTAASCVISPDGTPVDAGNITFRAGLIEGVALAESGVLRTIVPEGYRPTTPVSEAMIRKDLALLELATPIPSGVISAFSVASVNGGGDLSVVYYADARTQAPFLQAGCSLTVQQDGVFGLDCGPVDLVPGAPILERTGYRADVVGVASAFYMDQGRKVLLGMALPDAVAALKDALRRGEATSRAAADLGTGSKRLAPGAGNDTGAKFLSP